MSRGYLRGERPVPDQEEVRVEAVLRGHVGALFYATSDAVVIVEQGRVVGWNPRAEQLFATTAEQALSGAPTPLDRWLPGLLALPVDGGPVRTVMPPYATIEAVHRIVDDRDVLLLRDISDVVRREDGLARLAALSRTLLDGPQTVAAATQALVGEAKAMTGAAYSGLVLRRDGRDTGHPAGAGLTGVHPPVGPLLAVPLVAGEELLGELTVANPADGRCFDDLDEALLLDLAAYAAVALCWARRHEAEREQALLRQEVVDAARHDIRTPLGAGKGYAALLSTKMDRMSPTQIATALDGLRTSFDRIEAFSARLLVDDRIAAVGVVPQWGLVGVADLLEQVRRDAVVITGREDAVVVDHAPDAPSVLAGDAEMVREVVDNLVGNALKHGGAAGPVVLTVRPEGDHVRLDVHDSGPGIAESDQAALFERWSRTGASRAGMVPGLGLGLSIVKRFVQAHGGRCGLSSRVGEGATFWVTFPAAVPDDPT